MTYTTLKKASLATLAALAITTTLAPASAMATDAPTASFVVKSTTDGRVKLGVKAFKRGDFERSVRWSKSALEGSLSSRKEAVAYSNLCAAYAKLGQMEEAQEACDSALELRANYAPAIVNKASLITRLAQK
ncbi:hypothetical protein N9W89_00400 [Hellea sp.]|nr:hypothetical protein [Hellea sp.]